MAVVGLHLFTQTFSIIIEIGKQMSDFWYLFFKSTKIHVNGAISE